MTGAVFEPHDKPIRLSKAELLAVLQDLTYWITDNDSMEGYLKYQWSDEPGWYDVVGVLRYDNDRGQGSVRMLMNQDPTPTTISKPTQPVVMRMGVEVTDPTFAPWPITEVIKDPQPVEKGPA